MIQSTRCVILVLVGITVTLCSLSQVTATNVKDIAPGSQWSDPAFMVLYNGEIYFRADDKVHGRELWKSDGTEAGTVMVKDIYPGSAGSQPEWLTVSNGILYFSAYTTTNGWELWRSDGTEAGTYLFKDITPGHTATYENTSPAYMVDVNGTLYFVLDNSNPVVANRGLWKSDGTDAGTLKIAGTYLNSVGSGYIIPTDLINVNGMLFFIGNWPSLPDSRTLWKSDGTQAGTVMVSTNTARFPYGIQPAYLTAHNSDVYFAAKINNEGGAALWKSNGTDAGTVVVKDMNLSTLDGGVQFICNINNTLYFAGNTDNSNSELWKSDGSEAGTVLVKDINAGSVGSQPFGFSLHNGMVYFTANTLVYGREIWKTDGTTAGTTIVADLYPNAGTSVGLNPFFKVIESMNNNLYFIGILDNNLGQELYKLSENTLPVIWEELKISCNNHQPHIFWKTSFEINTKDFVIQASHNAINWVNIDSIPTMGNSNTTITYEYCVIDSRNPYRFYRLVQRDLDGIVTYSKTLTANCQKVAPQIRLFPNPANNIITVSNINSQDISSLEIMDVTGKKVISTSAITHSTINIKTLTKGSYFLRIISKNGSTVTRRFIKM
ncbi:MAG TPA: T9SS type A sorting domain-containing protein [Ferruginibacter sp.]|nr:T9SS type A sorting domain-containing protein [Ferruginibacter sp.]